ncbi:hypothetical protein KEM54_001164 [Ascosphaera aggregata]|nr:hypothetical protein KEM54_001164 [Ascosphaera aggregata]
MAQPTQLATRTLKGVALFNTAPVYEPVPGFTRPEGTIRCCAYSPCGKYFAYAAPDSVTIVDPSVGSVVAVLSLENVFEVGFSPRGTYIITWQRPSKDENGDATKNLKVWKVVKDEGADPDSPLLLVGQFVQRSQTGWNLQYTEDEKLCARTVTNEVQFFESGNLAVPWKKLRVEGVASFALSPGKSQSIAVFIPERKGLPASVKVFGIPIFNAPVSQKNFFKGDKVQLKWNSTGTTLIVLAQTDVDKSGKSYYGETTLYLLAANGAIDSRISLDKEGPIHDVSWSPAGTEFGVVYGFMPAKTTIFNTRGIATHSFPLAPRNTILFSPHSRFVLVAGFGNLAGQMDIYDANKDFAKICSIEASNASVCEWSPDGKHILTATTSPRLRVDNGVRIWHASGKLMYNEDMNELYGVTWRPQSTLQHPLDATPLARIPEPHPSATTYLATRKVPAKPAGAYRPPGARGQSTPLAFRREDQGGAAYVRDDSSSTLSSSPSAASSPFMRGGPGRGARRPPVPGAPEPEETPASGEEKPLSKSAAKNKKKREAKKLKELADKTPGMNVDGGADTAPTSEGETRGQQQQPQQQQRARSPGRKGHKNHRSRSTNRVQTRDSTSSLGGTNTGGGGGGIVNASNGRARHAHHHSASQSSRAQRAAAPAAVATPPAPAPEVTVTAAPGTGATPTDKKIRGLLKKLRAIEELRMRFAGGEKLEDTQMKKIHTEESVRREPEALGWNG